ncbi:MAG: hypothetical protein II874_05055 [Bacteroidales bacterium]|nr:hypothetical protein [Bacteroidales bacterium]
MLRRVLAALVAVLMPFCAQAQSSATGNDPGRLRWSSFRTRDYQLIYPRGLDSLATVYGTLLQQYSVPLSATAGLRPNELFLRPMPVVLHPYTGVSNGMVAWAPRRMDIFTLPDVSGLTPVPWAKLLAIHEGRHVAQKQYMRTGFWTGFHYLFGELPETLIGTVPNSSLLEGDAVVAETALTRAGRGRSGDFLSEMRMFFNTGDLRNWYQWRYGSIKRYTPDIYRLGYLTIAGFRYLYDDPTFMEDYMRITATFGGIFTGMNTASKKASGKKLPVAWNEMMGNYRNLWARNDSLRAPFSETEPHVDLPRHYTVYSGAVPAGGDIYAEKAGMDHPAVLVRISPDGKEKTLTAFGGDGKLAWSAPLQRVYWSEAVPDVRWTLKQDARIRYYDTKTGHKGSLVRKGRYFSPALSPDGLSLCAVEYPTDGSAAVVVLDARNGQLLRRWAAPDGFQPTEAVFQDAGLVVAAITEEGTGLYLVPRDGGRPETLLEPQPVTVKDLSAVDGNTILLVCDRTGTSEAYTFSAGAMTQLSVTKYGLGTPFFADGRLYASVLRPEGRLLSQVECVPRKVEFKDLYRDPVAEVLSAQEAQLAASLPEEPLQMTPAKPFRKISDAFHFHSWAPVYVDLSRANVSFRDYYFQTASLGATGIFANRLGTVSGSIGLSFHGKASPEDKTPGVGAHFRMSYSGLYPVFDFALDVGDRDAALQIPYWDTAKDSTFIHSSPYGTVYVGGMASVSLPLDFSSGGWERKIEPSLALSLSNDDLYGPFLPVKVDPAAEGGYSEDESYPGKITWKSRSTAYRTSAVLRGSFLRPAARSQMMASKGFGFEVGATSTDFNWSEFGKVYAYLPGFHPWHGLKISGAVRHYSMDRYSTWFTDPCPPAPRGLAKNARVEALLLTASPLAGRVSLDYAMPIFPMDYAIGNIFYFRNFEVVPFADVTFLQPAAGIEMPGNLLWSAGADIAVNIQRLVLVSGNFSIGARLAYSGGSAFPFLQEQIPGLKPFYIGAVFNTEL